MKRTYMYAMIACCVLMAMFIAVPSQGYRAIDVIDDLKHGSGKIGTYRALIIGINDYKDPKIPDLKTPLNDARSMAGMLQEKYGFVVETILGKRATKKSVYNALRNLSSMAKPDDSILIYYAGHGDLDKQYNDGWWIPYDATAGDPLTYLDNTQVQKAMRSTKARHVLLISDSCYSGTLFGQARSMPPVIDNKYYLGLYNEKSRWGMTSGNKTPVADDGTGGHSVFAYQLIKELKNNNKPYLSTQEIYTRIAPVVSNNSEQTPLCRPIRNTGDQGGEFVFIVSSSAIVEMPASAVKTKAILFIASNVTGARVFVDGRSVGTTPLSDVEVPEGEHRILVEKQGYDTYRKKARFEAGRALSMYVVLSKKEPLKGRLYVETDPESARVRILNIGPAFYQGMDLEPGRYHVEASAKGYETEKQWVTLGAGEDKYLDINLKQTSVVSSGYQGQKISNSLGMEFVYIPPGSFTMGSPQNESGRNSDEKQHRISLTKGYYLQTTEVTRGQWQAVMGREYRFLAFDFKGNCGNDCPIVFITWNDVQEFINRLNRDEGSIIYRLPTEAEWEYAARAGSTTRFCFGDEDDLLSEYAWYNVNSNKKANDVAQKKPNAWGLYDMHGNVWEWCQDWYGDYPTGLVVDPTGVVSGSQRVMRGGCYEDKIKWCRSASRYKQKPTQRIIDTGFRLVRMPDINLSKKRLAKIRLYVETQPENAKIRILNVGPAYYQGMQLAPGRYHVKVYAEGFQSKKLWITLREGEDKYIDISLKQVSAIVSDHQGQKISNSLGMEFVYIPPGSFTMGSPQNESGRSSLEKQHRVILTKGFFMQTTEVTQGQWTKVMKNNPSHFNVCGDNCPVEKVSWHDAQEFIHKLNQKEGGNKYRLPTAAEWEYAARAGSTTRFCFGDEDDLLSEYAWYWNNSGNKTHVVAQKKPNAWGLYDMHGNVFEWNRDWIYEYPSGSVTDPVGHSGSGLISLCGGSWESSADYCRSASRRNCNQDCQINNLGFRLVRAY